MALEITFNDYIKEGQFPEAKEVGLSSILVDTDHDTVLIGSKAGEIKVFINKECKTYNNVIRVSPYNEEE